MNHFARLFCALLAFAAILAASARAEDMTVLMPGSSGQGVTLLQSDLAALGYLDDAPDGRYGPATEAAVAAFNRDHGILAASSASFETCAALRAASFGNAAIDIGASDCAVYAVQKLLRDAGFLSAAPDGVFGAASKRAAREYMVCAAEAMADYLAPLQAARLTRASGAATDGEMPVAVDIPIVSPETVVTDGAITPDWLAFMARGETLGVTLLRVGDKGDSVARMQKRLIALNYLARGADGAFGENTRLALCYFQRRNGLAETGELDQATQRLLFSDGAAPSDETVSPYKAYVSTKKNKVAIYRWTGEGYGERVKTFTCTTGARATPTIKGTFHAAGQAGSWYHMKKSNCWVRYAFVIQGNYFFHSVLFSSRESASPTRSSVRNLGKNASHGCIRLAVEDVKWIYDNCAPGMTVVIE